MYYPALLVHELFGNPGSGVPASQTYRLAPALPSVRVYREPPLLREHSAAGGAPRPALQHTLADRHTPSNVALPVRVDAGDLFRAAEELHAPVRAMRASRTGELLGALISVLPPRVKRDRAEALLCTSLNKKVSVIDVWARSQ